jgi:hypothetical protein
MIPENGFHLGDGLYATFHGWQIVLHKLHGCEWREIALGLDEFRKLSAESERRAAAKEKT